MEAAPTEPLELLDYRGQSDFDACCGLLDAPPLWGRASGGSGESSQQTRRPGPSAPATPRRKGRKQYSDICSPQLITWSSHDTTAFALATAAPGPSRADEFIPKHPVKFAKTMKDEAKLRLAWRIDAHRVFRAPQRVSRDDASSLAHV